MASATRAAASASETVETDLVTGANIPSTATIPIAKITTAATTSSSENPRVAEPRSSFTPSGRLGGELDRDSGCAGDKSDAGRRPALPLRLAEKPVDLSTCL